MNGTVHSDGAPTLELRRHSGALEVRAAGRLLFRHGSSAPAIMIGRGEPSFRMRFGSFRVDPGLSERRVLKGMPVVERESDDRITLAWILGQVDVARLDLRVQEGRIHGSIICAEPWNRVWLRFAAPSREPVYGAGEQYSRLNLRGSRLPLWSTEQGVGRAGNLTKVLANIHSGAGGHWHSTYFPQPSWIGDGGRWIHLENSAYTVLDFRGTRSDLVETWESSFDFVIGLEESAAAAVGALSAYLGRQPGLADWADRGMWLGLQGGTETILRKKDAALAAGIPLSGLWVQDWEGRRVTAFGSQLFWDWRYSQEMYPRLPDTIAGLKKEGIRFLGYINPFLAIEGELYKEASARGFCVKDARGNDAMIVVTTFPAALLDLSNPDAFEWIKGVIRENMLGIGLSGWMADYGEYLPTDIRLHHADPHTYHNRYPAEWARANYEAVREAGRLDDTVVFMRAGFTGSSRYAHSIWAGDQMVDWSRHDGLPSVMPAALSAGMCGIGIHHSDLGGFTTLFHKKRPRELMIRWAEQAAFTPLMRSHEGNRPADNVQWDADAALMREIARIVSVFVALRPYRRSVLEEYSATGLPAMRPVFLHYPEVRRDNGDIGSRQYLFGRDLYVAPVLHPGRSRVAVNLPDDRWIDLWTGRDQRRGAHAVDAPLGYPAVFYRASADQAGLFREITERFGRL